MNKEVIYLEPEDDITDILTKLQQAEQKLVALVPPKKATMLRSAVNMKLVARVAKECEKIAVIVTSDPAIVKMAMAAHIPVAKSLQSRPVVPTEEDVRTAEAEIDVYDEETGEITTEKASDSDTEAKDDAMEMTSDEIDESEEPAPRKSDKKSAKPEKSAKKAPNFHIDKIRKYLIIGVPVAIVAICVLVWAFVFAPAVTITVSIPSQSANINETVRFTTDPTKEDIPEGILYASPAKLEQKYTTKFTASGEEDKGDKAKGTITASLSFNPKSSGAFKRSVDTGDILVTSDGYEFVVTKGGVKEYDGEHLPSGCTMSHCVLNIDAEVEAKKSGTEYNISAATSWEIYDNDFTIRNSSAFSGGTSKMETVVSQADIDKAVDAMISEHTDDGRKYLYEDLGDDRVAIESSFHAEPGETVSTPAVSEQPAKDTEPSVTATIIYSVYTVEKSSIEAFIRHKQQIGEDQRLYSIGNPYFERYTAITEPVKLKTTIETGPIVSEDQIYERAKGHKTGEVQPLIRDIRGVGTVEVRTSYFWVWSVPENRDKVTVIIEAKGDEE